MIDVPELSTLRAQPRRAPGTLAQAVLDVPILPYGIDLAAADIGLGLKRVVLGRAELADVGVSARIRDGRLVPSPFSARFAGVPFEGFVGARPARHSPRRLAVDVHQADVDVGALLRKLGVADDIDAHAGVLEVKLAGPARNLGELLEHGSLEARLLGGDITRARASGRAVAEIKLEQALVTALPGKAVHAAPAGRSRATSRHRSRCRPGPSPIWLATPASCRSRSRRTPPALVSRSTGTSDAAAGRGGDLAWNWQASSWILSAS